MMSMNKLTSVLMSSLRSMQSTHKIWGRGFQSADEVEKELIYLDPFQVKLLEEVCIEVNEEDQIIGPRTKKDCHLMKNIHKGLLHRAFSVFLFNSKGEFLLQQRSDTKITFPSVYSNTCCSHPLFIESEINAFEGIGVKRAAQRRLHLELGIHPDSISLNEFQYMTKVKYAMPSNDKWGENEISYLLFVQKDVEINPNPEEIKECVYLSKENLMPFLADKKNEGYEVSPWFQLIADQLLFHYWDNLKNLKPLRDHTTILDLQA